MGNGAWGFVSSSTMHTCGVRIILFLSATRRRKLNARSISCLAGIAEKFHSLAPSERRDRARAAAPEGLLHDYSSFSDSHSRIRVCRAFCAGSRQLSRRTAGRDGWREYFFENVSDDCALCGRGIIADVKTREPIVSSSTDSDNHLHAP